MATAHRHRGFTLIEMVITLIVVGLLTSFAVHYE